MKILKRALLFVVSLFFFIFLVRGGVNLAMINDYKANGVLAQGNIVSKHFFKKTGGPKRVGYESKFIKVKLKVENRETQVAVKDFFDKDYYQKLNIGDSIQVRFLPKSIKKSVDSIRFREPVLLEKTLSLAESNFRWFLYYSGMLLLVIILIFKYFPIGDKKNKV